MKQAIEEGYVLDVLRGYHSFQMAFKVAGTASTEVEVDQSEATMRGQAQPADHRPEVRGALP